MVKYDLGSVIGPKGDKGDTGPQGPQGPKGDNGSDATATPLTDTVTQGDTTHAVTGNAVYTAIQQIRTDNTNILTDIELLNDGTINLKYVGDE